MAEAPRIRPAVRIVLIDPRDRVLLFRIVRPDGRALWCPPGGGIEPGETIGDAAHRELREETGLMDVRVGPEMWRRRHVFEWRGVLLDHRERWMLARAPTSDIDTSGFTASEREDIDGHRWWTVDELRSTTDDLVPRDLAARVRDLLSSGPPSAPIDIGV